MGGPYCLTKDATKRGSGTIGEHVNVDFWEARYDDGTFHEEIDILMEGGSTTIPVQERVYGNISMKPNNSSGIGQNTENGLNFQQTKLTLQFLMFLLDAPHKSNFLYYLTLTFFYATLALEFL